MTDTTPGGFPYRQQPHRYCGSNSDRQSVGDPGHCEDCCSVGHVTAHPDLGCGDVGCGVAHGPEDLSPAETRQARFPAPSGPVEPRTPPPACDGIPRTATDELSPRFAALLERTPMTTYVRFIEINDNEGETWNFWLQRDGNDEALERLRSHLNFVNEGNEYEDEFSMTDDELTATQVDLLVQFAEDGYMASHGKVNGHLALPDDFEHEDLSRLLYKGGIRDLFTEEV